MLKFRYNGSIIKASSKQDALSIIVKGLNDASLSKGFDKAYFDNYGYDGDTSYEASVTMSDDAFNPGIALYKKLNSKYPRTYVELGCGNGHYINRMLKYGVRSCVGCDFSDYFDNNIVCPKENFFKNDSISFLKTIDYPIDLVYETTCQYLNDSDLDTLLSMLSNKIRNNGILIIVYDDSRSFHLYRKQIHNRYWWKTFIKRYRFKPTQNQFVFIKQ